MKVRDILSAISPAFIGIAGYAVVAWQGWGGVVVFMFGVGLGAYYQWESENREKEKRLAAEEHEVSKQSERKDAEQRRIEPALQIKGS